LSVEEVKLLLENIADNKNFYNFVQMALSTGARLESVLNIQKKDIDLKYNKITIKDLKNSSTYTGFFSSNMYMQEVGESISKIGVNDYYVGSKSTKFASRTLQRQLKPILDRLFNRDLDIKDTKNRVVIHTLRHTFASQLAIAGVPIFTIKTLMNHSSIDMTMRYAKLTPESGSMAVKGLYN